MPEIVFSRTQKAPLRLLMPGIVPYQFTIKHNANDYEVIEPDNITVKALNGDTNFDHNDYISLSIV